VKFVKWLPNSTTLLSAGYDDFILASDLGDDGEFKQNDDVVLKHDSTVWALDYHNGVLASVSGDLTLKIWNSKSGISETDFVLSQTFSGLHEDPIYTCSFNHTGEILATGGGDNQLNLFVVA
jgi:WD40 repeat protein